MKLQFSLRLLMAVLTVSAMLSLLVSEPFYLEGDLQSLINHKHDRKNPDVVPLEFFYPHDNINLVIIERRLNPKWQWNACIVFTLLCVGTTMIVVIRAKAKRRNRQPKKKRG